MGKATTYILYIAILLTLWAPTIELIRGTIIPGVEQLTITLQEVAR